MTSSYERPEGGSRAALIFCLDRYDLVVLFDHFSESPKAMLLDHACSRRLVATECCTRAEYRERIASWLTVKACREKEWPTASIADLSEFDVLLVSAQFLAGTSVFGRPFGLVNQAVRASLDLIAKRLHHLFARLFAFESVSADPYLQHVFAGMVLVFYFRVL
jgi:hypothetical protein